MSEININGTIIKGSNITILNGKVIVDGKSVSVEGPKINITINGPVDTIDVDMCEKIVVTGDVNKVTTTSGNVQIQGHVKNDIKTTSGDVEVGSTVHGNIGTVSGSVKCGEVAGNVKTVSGNIN